MDLREIPEAAFQRHPWETARAAFFLRVLTSSGLGVGPARVLDVGAGDAYFATRLHDTLPAGTSVACVDANYDTKQLERLQREVAGRAISFHREPPAGPFDAVVLLDVLEHVSNPEAFLSALVREQLQPGGLVLASVPAWGRLFTRHDVALGHYRRYAPSELRTVLAAAGLRPVLRGGLFSSLLPLRALAKARERLSGVRSVPDPVAMPDRAATDAGAWNRGRAVTVAVERALAVDARLCLVAAKAGTPLPALSTWEMARS